MGKTMKNTIEVEGLTRQGFYQTEPGVQLYYALFGQGPTKIVLLMGIGTSGLAWKHQIEYFVRFPEYQVLVVDNRGCGQTVTPGGRITTTQMARDVALLMKHLGWDKTKIHLVGNSLGGMIAQELALMVPWQIATLSLINTHAGGWRALVRPPWRAIVSLSRHVFTTCEKKKTRAMLETVFSKGHLYKPGSKEFLSVIDDQYPTICDFYVTKFTEQFKAIMAQEHAGRLFCQQLTAVLTHNVSTKRLTQLKGKFPIMVFVSTGDKVVHPSNSYHIVKALDADMVTFDGAGHAVTEECLDDVNNKLRNHFWKACN